MIENNYKENWNKQCIYMFKNSVNPKVYIGGTKNLYTRIAVHKNYVKYNKNMLITRAISEIGYENFELEILEIVEDHKFLRERERFYIDEYKADDINFGYNELCHNKINPKRKILCITTGITYKSLIDAYRKTGAQYSHICCCCRDKRNYAGRLEDGTPLTWRYVE
jgi:hypothetical protein